MDPRLVIPRDEFNSLQTEVKSHAERLSRLERRQQDDAALKSVWNSPFPSVLTGTPQQDLAEPISADDYFNGLDEQSDHLLGSLHLDPTDEEPIRRGTASRANSVRFAESAIQGSASAWNASQNRTSSDFGLVRPGSSLMMERSLSHKSDGRHSSTGHSVHSILSTMSGRASSLGLDGDDDDDSSIGMPEPPPSLFIMGSVPSIVRCWLTPKFSHDTLLYADICTGSQKSTLEFALAKELDLHHTLERDINGNYTLTLPVYLAEAIVTQPHSRSNNGHSHQIPTVMVTFEVVDLDANDVTEHPSLKIFIGSDALRAHSADVLLSQNKLVLYSTERDKLSVPFVRPEDERVFKNICTRNLARQKSFIRLDATAAPFISGGELKFLSSQSVTKSIESHQSSDDLEGDVNGASAQAYGHSSPDPMPATRLSSSKSAYFPTPFSMRSDASEGDRAVATKEQQQSSRPSLALSENGSLGNQQKQPSASAQATTATQGAASSGSGEPEKRHELNVGIWGSWRNGTISSDRENGLSGYQPAGKSTRTMKVLKPSRNISSARTVPSITTDSTASTSASTIASTAPTTPRTLSDPKRKEGAGQPSASTPTTAPTLAATPPSMTSVSRWESKRSVSATDAKFPTAFPVRDSVRQGSSSSTSSNALPRSSNPVGSASAFSWMNPNGKAKTPVGE
ncbi:hypothetical protein Cpir12675_005318 [Ceratocystis pirilliformis]|uniref:Ubiquitin carboxyl-terminal hydrolase 19 n=1 Tax=Ceratocystis pirilliformis TaxID=259994 RepID=A0ABR3YRN3_9PEZI